jgi:segregation and condensation protein A
LDSDTMRGEGSYEVKLQDFEGPLDLLLHLIRKNEVDIYDIPIAQITDQYLEHLMRMRELNLEVAGEFVLMAATLIYMKSKMLLPQPSPAEEEALQEDPRRELVERLVEYRKYKEAALLLEIKEDQFQKQYTNQPLYNREDPPALDPEIDLFRLLSVFYDLLKRTADEPSLVINREELDIHQSMVEILDHFGNRESLTLRTLLQERPSRLQMIVTFLALLELIRRGILKVKQQHNFGEICIYRLG